MPVQNLILIVLGGIMGVALVVAVYQFLKRTFEWILKVAIGVSLVAMVFGFLYVGHLFYSSSIPSSSLEQSLVTTKLVNAPTTKQKNIADQTLDLLISEIKEITADKKSMNAPTMPSNRKTKRKVDAKLSNYSFNASSKQTISREKKRVEPPVIKDEDVLNEVKNTRRFTRPPKYDDIETVSSTVDELEVGAFDLCSRQQVLADAYYLVEFFCADDNNAARRVKLLEVNGFTDAVYIKTTCFETDVSKDLLAVLITEGFDTKKEVLKRKFDLREKSSFPFKTLRILYLGLPLK